MQSTPADSDRPVEVRIGEFFRDEEKKHHHTLHVVYYFSHSIFIKYFNISSKPYFSHPFGCCCVFLSWFDWSGGGEAELDDIIVEAGIREI